MRLLITGASGFLGRNFLLASDPAWKVDAVYHGANDFPAFVAHAGLRHVKVHRCDLSVEAQVRAMAAILPERFDAILYLASNSDPAAAAVDPLADMMSGSAGLVTLLSAVRSNRLVYLSSGAVYEGLGGEVGPHLPVAPCLPYAVSKLASEGYVRWFRRTGRVGGYVILRLFAAYGPLEAPRRLSTRLVRWAASGARKPFEIRGDGRNLIDTMYVGDVVRGIKAVIASDVFDEVVDFVTGTPLTINDLVNRAARILNVQAAQVRHVGKVPEYQEFVASGVRMEELFEFSPEIPLERGLLELQEHLVAEVRQ